MRQNAVTTARSSRTLSSSFYSAPITAEDRPVETIASRALDDRDERNKVGVHTEVASLSSRFQPSPNLRNVKEGKAHSFTVVKEWEGVVQEVGISHFSANLVETRGGHDELDVAEIPISDIPRESRDDLREGGIFRYLIGYATDAHGTVTKKRLVYFRKGRQSTDSGLEQSWLDMMANFKHDPFSE